MLFDVIIWSKASVPSYESPFQPKPLCSSHHKPKLRPTKDFEAKYNKVTAKLALLSSSASASKAISIKNKGLITKAYEWDEEEVSSDDNEMVEVKVLMALAEENDAISKEGAKNGPKVVFGDDSTCITKGYGSIKCNGKVFTKVAFVNGLKYNLISISQLCDDMYIIQFDEKRGTIFDSNKEVVMIAPRVREV
ncbi:hypothetical protein Tco_1264792 [Tanacetum coccineum]